MSGNNLTYWDYLKLDTLLKLQNGFNSDESEISSDELQFIVVHQTLELWFKVFIRDIRDIRDLMNKDFIPETTIPIIVEKLRRTNQIIRLATNHFDVLETLLPQNFLAFRNKLGTASGFQSVQMRELEILLGLTESQRVSLGKYNAIKHIKNAAILSEAGRRAWERIESLNTETTLKDAVYSWLYRTPINGSSPDNSEDEKVVTNFIGDYLKGYKALIQEQMQKLLEINVDETDAVDQRVKTAIKQVEDFLSATNEVEDTKKKIQRTRAGILFIESYRQLPLLAWPRLLLDSLVELEENLILFRTKHARMVERMIGRRVGTGGSAGVDYLDQTTKYRIFTDLWAVRTTLLPKNNVPVLKNERFYDFVTK